MLGDAHCLLPARLIQTPRYCIINCIFSLPEISILAFCFTLNRSVMRVKLLSFCLLFPLLIAAQSPGDTIVIPAFNYTQTNSPNGRDTMIQFPDDPGTTYEKIIMAYNMRCKDGLVSNSSFPNRGCGEWDYSCNTYIYDSTRVDSVLSFYNSHFITHFSGDTFHYVTDPIYDHFQYLQQQVVINNIVSENPAQLGNGILELGHVIMPEQNSGKSMFLFTAQELSTAGLSAGEIDAITIQAVNSSSADFFRLRMKHTGESMLDESMPDTGGFTEVYFHDHAFVSGDNRIQFYQPFTWDGASNVILEFSFTNDSPSSTLEIEGEDVGPGLGMYTTNGTHIINDAGYTSVPTGAFGAISDEITVSFWCYGNPDFLPANTSILYGKDSLNNRQLNIHLPWGNSSVYFDCGYEGGYDRINKGAAVDELEGKWNHWAFTKNASSGDMRIFLNGSLWHSGSSKTRLIDIVDFSIGTLNYSRTRYYYGRIDEFRMWASELDSTDIQDWMHTSIDNTHPYYSDLVAYYPFEEGSGTTTADASVHGETATIHDYVMWDTKRGVDLSRHFIPVTERPNVTFLQGDYDLTITDELLTVSEEKIANRISTYEIIPRWGTMLDDSISLLSEEYVWEAGYEYTYDPSGAVIDSLEIAATDNVVITELEYFRRFPAKVELMSFVTPYGLGLDLGMDGKTWYFDVSDYVDILKGWKRMTMEWGGQRQEDIDIKFHYIVGTPPRDVLEFRQIWRPDKRGYQDIKDDRAFEPRDMLMHADGDEFIVKTVITGHGQEGEFVPRYHKINVDGGMPEYSWKIWTECSTIPIYPQGGTWLYDRAGWCPGDPSTVYVHSITDYVVPGQVHNIDYNIVNASGATSYIVNQQLMTYGPPNFTLDAAIVSVTKPNAAAAYERFNPACSYPVAIIKNTGSDTLTSLMLEYGVEGGNLLTQEWTGNLSFMDTTEVHLEIPGYGFWQGSSNKFSVSISEPNGQSDEYPHNNSYSLEFEEVELVDMSLVPLTVECKTNNQGSQTSYSLTDLEGNVILERSGLESNTLYSDEVSLGLGCYRLRIDDSGDNGLYYWHQPGNGSGYFRIKGNDGISIETFEPEFGRFAVFEFAVADMTGTGEMPGNESIVGVYPNPARDLINIDIMVTEDTRFTASLFNASMLKLEQLEFIAGKGNHLEQINIEELPSGMYFLRLQYGDHTTVKKIIKY